MLGSGTGGEKVEGGGARRGELEGEGIEGGGREERGGDSTRESRSSEHGGLLSTRGTGEPDKATGFNKGESREEGACAWTPRE